MASGGKLFFVLSGLLLVLAAAFRTAAASAADTAPQGAAARAALNRIGAGAGICAVLGLPQPEEPEFVAELAKGSKLLVYFQSPNEAEAAGVRKAAEEAGLLGNRVFVDRGDWKSIHLATNLAGAVLAGPAARAAAPLEEILRVLHPRGKAILADKEIVRPFPQGIDPWSHPYHGPDNNPLSTDQIARAPYLTQFLAEPMFCPMPEVSVAAGGRVFRAFGHIAHKANQNAMLNTLICVNGYNGTILWKRPLREGFMIHRNTMIATPDTLYLADDQSCKLIDADTGEVKDEIVIPKGLGDGVVWKWIALQDGVLYALIGGEEVKPATQRSETPGLGHWPWGMWQGHDYKDRKTNFGFGRTLAAVDPASKKILWSRNEEQFLDSRGLCMKSGRIYFYSPEKFLGCLDAKTGEPVWKNSDSDLLAAIGPNGPAQHYVTGYATTTYMKCTDDYIFFAGPQRSRLAVASTKDGKLVWRKELGNLQLVLREDAVYAAGPQQPDESTGWKLAYATGEMLGKLHRRRACTRATGSVDSIFYRAQEGTVRFDLAANTARLIAPMRPPCQDGVIIANGLLYWGPWMCGCPLSLYGHICLGPAGDFNFHPPLDPSRWEAGSGDPGSVKEFEILPGDWPCYRGDNSRTGLTNVVVPDKVRQRWAFQLPAPGRPTAPAAAGGMVFFGDESGVVWALDADGGVRWRTHTGGAVYCAPAVWNNRLYVGSADGRVYAYEAATGRRLWRFRAAPAERWISVYGKLISTWPVAGGVVADQGVVYAAAGIAHYDGAYVYALDAVTGKVKWCNDTSGSISDVTGSGVSLQGNLYVRNGELRFLAGSAYETASYDLKTGKCLNEAYDKPGSRFETAFYPYFPQYGKHLSLDCDLPDGRWLVYDASYEGSRHSSLALKPAFPPGAVKPVVEESRWRSVGGRQAQQLKAVWQDKSGRRFSAFVVGPNLLLAAGQAGPNEGGAPILAAVNIQDGSDTWLEKLPAMAVPGGAAIDHARRIFVSLEDGRVLCFTPEENPAAKAAQ